MSPMSAMMISPRQRCLMPPQVEVPQKPATRRQTGRSWQGGDEFRFENPLPIPDVIDTSKRKHVTLQVQQIDQFLGLYDENGDPLGYGTGQNASYPGPTILAYQGQTVTVSWQNKLPVDGHLLPVDTSLDRRAGFFTLETSRSSSRAWRWR
jgi:hypothetical protein